MHILKLLLNIGERNIYWAVIHSINLPLSSITASVLSLNLAQFLTTKCSVHGGEYLGDGGH